MFLIVGLGNPGEQYVRNRHNIGFQCVDYLADRHRLRFGEKQHKARLASGMIHGQRVVLAKPFTYMNDSGQSVAALVRWHKLDPAAQLLVIYDDLDLPFETIRLRASGSAGGQNGMRSIIQHLGGQNFPRLRVGIGRPTGRQDPKDYVLGNWSREQSEKLPTLYARVADAVETVIAEGLTLAMTRFNAPDQSTKPKPSPPAASESNSAAQAGE